MAKKAETLPDTNYILRYLLRDDALQYTVVEPFFEQVRSGRERIIIMEGVLVECLYILTKQYHVSRCDAAKALIGLFQYKGVVNPEKELLVDALSRYAETKLDPVDSLLIARADASGLKILSFDKELNSIVISR